MNVLVTGGLGFQGGHLTRRLLHRGHHVTILNTPSARARLARDRLCAGAPFSHGILDVVWGSVTSPLLVRSCVDQADVVVHLAAVANPEACREDPTHALLVNVRGTQHILDMCREYRKRLLHVSTCEVYGAPTSDGLLQHEDSSPLNPAHIYGATKAAADRLAYAYALEFHMSIVIVRPCNVYGPYQQAGEHGAVIPTMTTRALRGETIIVRGSPVREFVHVDDVTRWYVQLIEHEDAGAVVLNLGTGERVSIPEIAEIIARETGAPIELAAPRPSEPRAFALDLSRARANGFESSISFASGLVGYIEWARDFYK